MNKYLKIIVVAVLVGSLFALYMFKGISKTFALTFNENKQITVFQSGVFKDESNALVEKNKYDQAIVIKDDNLYRVYIGVSYDDEVTLAYENYFKKLNYSYYCKKLNVSDIYLNKLKKYEEIIKKSFNEDTYVNINKDLLIKLSEELL